MGMALSGYRRAQKAPEPQEATGRGWVWELGCNEVARCVACEKGTFLVPFPGLGVWGSSAGHGGVKSRGAGSCLPFPPHHALHWSGGMPSPLACSHCVGFLTHLTAFEKLI